MLMIEYSPAPKHIGGLLPKDLYTVSLSNSLALRVYSDTRPFNWKIANLQKGLILVYKGVEAVGEGTGFGVPIGVYSDETYFSGLSNVRVCQREGSTIIRKEFLMDRVARNGIGDVKLENRRARAAIKHLAGLYQRHRRLRFLKWKGLLKRIDVNTSFVKFPSVGKVAVTYSINQARLLVRADFTYLKKDGFEKFFMFNEQSSRFFRRYSDSEGAQLVDDEIGAWDEIKAEWASVTDSSGTFGFRLQPHANSKLRRGREFLKDSLDWVGLDYDVDVKDSVFEYQIEVLGV
jgi:hypothetical protein